MKNVAPYAKAVVAGVTTFAGAYGTAFADGSVTTPEWVGIAAATVVATASVWAVKNKPADGDSPIE